MVKKVCLITSGHLASNPRLVKEAGALSEAGYDVRVVCADYFIPLKEEDERIIAEASWSAERISYPSGLSFLAARLLQECSRYLAALGIVTKGSAARAESLLTAGLTRSACSASADLYIAHTLAALPAAALAAQKVQAPFAFDAEDFHLGEWTKNSPLGFMGSRRCLEQEFLPKCAYVSASSPLVAQAYKAEYKVEAEVVLNVFPLSQAAKSVSRGSNSLYWFSQTIGKDRGIEQVLQALAQMKKTVDLHLRGFISPEYQEHLEKIAHELDLSERLHIHPAAPPEQMVELASLHSAGIAIEQEFPIHRDLCLANKLFTYLLAGLPVVLNNTTAHKSIVEDLGEAAIQIDEFDSIAFAHQLDKLFSNEEELSLRKKKASQLAHERFNWDLEKVTFLALVEGALQ